VTLMNLTDPSQEKRPIVQALEDSLVVMALTSVTALVAVGYPPSVSALYVPMLSAVVIGIITYMKARGIQKV
jgi:hypothetical protein